MEQRAGVADRADLGPGIGEAVELTQALESPEPKRKNRPTPPPTSRRRIFRGGSLKEHEWGMEMPGTPASEGEGSQVIRCDKILSMSDASKRTYKGIVRDGAIVLRDDCDLPEGASVDVRIEPVRRGEPGAVLAAVKASPHVDESAVDERMKKIGEGRQPVRFDSALD